MKKTTKFLLSSVLVVAVFFGSFFEFATLNADTKASITNLEIASDGMEWTYLDRDVEVGVRESAIINDPKENGKLTGEIEITGDPNAYTWFSRWNKRNGWAYPSTFLDHGLFNMDFSPEKWATGSGKSFSTDASLNPQVELLKNDDGSVREGYFLRYSFNIEDPKQIYAITGNVTYKDAMIMYINGKPVESLFNIPMSNYSKNMQYGSNEAVGAPITEDFLVEDVSSLTKGENTIAIELHTSNKDSEAYFSLNSFMLNPSEENLPESDPVKAIAINPGEDETKMNFAWYSLSDKAGEIQIMEGSNTSEFNEAQATVVPASAPVLAYKKFISTKYYSNKVVFNDVEPGKKYLYRFGNADAWSDVYELRTSDISNGYETIFLSDPQIGTGTVPTDVYGWKQTLNNAFSNHPNASFIINTGDFVDVATKEGEYDGYFAPDQLKNYPSATAVGNHDIAVNYSYHFNEPNLSELGKTEANSNYYYTYGKVLYIVLNTSFLDNTEHTRYLEQVIEETKDMDLDWKVVMFHQSVYSGGTQATIQGNIDRRNDLVPTFDRLGIDLALMGHDHGYVRTHQMKGFKPQEPGVVKDGYEINPKGTLYVTASSASGSKYYPSANQPTISEYINKSVFGSSTYTKLSFKGNRFALTTYAMNEDGTSSIVDEYGMEKDVNRTELNQAIELAEGKDLTKYTAESVQVYQASIEVARQALADQNARQSKIDDALSVLKSAEEGLVELSDAPTQQTLSSKDGEVSVSGVLHSGVSLNVAKGTDATANVNYAKLKAEEGFKGHAAKASYEISLNRNNSEYQPTGDVVVKIKQDASLTDKKVTIAHVHDNVVEFVKPELIEGYYVFTVSKFSSFFVNYANVGGTGEETKVPGGNSEQKAANKAVASGDSTNIALYLFLIVSTFGVVMIGKKRKQ